jgi:alkaline phosphatase D
MCTTFPTAASTRNLPGPVSTGASRAHAPCPRFPRLGPAAARASLLACAALAALPVRAGVAQGPLVQALTSQQAGIWVRTSIDQPVRVRYHQPNGDNLFTNAIVTSANSDDTAKFVLAGLAPGSAYGYEVGTTDPASGVESWTGTYTLQTVQEDVATLRVAVLSDFHNYMVASAAVQTAINQRPDLVATIGDLDHRGPATGPDGIYPPEDAPKVLADMRSMHRDSRDPKTPLGANFYPGIVGAPNTGVPQIPMVYAWDDHDFCSNNSDKSCPFFAQSFQAYNEYYILAPDNAYTAGCRAPADFESLSYGNLATLFFLDARSERNHSNADGRTAMLGTCQHNWLIAGLHASKALWKIVLSPVPLNPTMKTWDAWSHFGAERTALLAAIADVPNVVFVTGDVHTGGAIDEGEHSGRPEVATPHANMPADWVNTYCRVQSGVLVSRPGSWSIGGLVDPIIGVRPMNCLKRTFPDDYPTDGMPAPVYPLDGKRNPGYTWIEATPDSLTIDVRGTDGNVKQGVRADGSGAALQLKLFSSLTAEPAKR